MLMLIPNPPRARMMTGSTGWATLCNSWSLLPLHLEQQIIWSPDGRWVTPTVRAGLGAWMHQDLWAYDRGMSQPALPAVREQVALQHAAAASLEAMERLGGLAFKPYIRQLRAALTPLCPTPSQYERSGVPCGAL